jgi:hypothetical protein
MFLTNPTLEELKALDISMLLDMLSYQTTLYVQLVKEEGLSNTAGTCKECIINIQTVIAMKKNLEKNTTPTVSDISFTQDSTRIDPPA